MKQISLYTISDCPDDWNDKKEFIISLIRSGVDEMELLQYITKLIGGVARVEMDNCKVVATITERGISFTISGEH